MNLRHLFLLFVAMVASGVGHMAYADDNDPDPTCEVGYGELDCAGKQGDSFERCRKERDELLKNLDGPTGQKWLDEHQASCIKNRQQLKDAITAQKAAEDKAVSCEQKLDACEHPPAPVAVAKPKVRHHKPALVTEVTVAKERRGGLPRREICAKYDVEHGYAKQTGNVCECQDRCYEVTRRDGQKMVQCDPREAHDIFNEGINHGTWIEKRVICEEKGMAATDIKAVKFILEDMLNEMAEDPNSKLVEKLLSSLQSRVTQITPASVDGIKADVTILSQRFDDVARQAARAEAKADEAKDEARQARGDARDAKRAATAALKAVRELPNSPLGVPKLRIVTDLSAFGHSTLGGAGGVAGSLVSITFELRLIGGLHLYAGVGLGPSWAQVFGPGNGWNPLFAFTAGAGLEYEFSKYFILGTGFAGEWFSLGDPVDVREPSGHQYPLRSPAEFYGGALTLRFPFTDSGWAITAAGLVGYTHSTILEVTPTSASDNVYGYHAETGVAAGAMLSIGKAFSFP